MADKAISALPSASEITLTDLFVLEQANAAKSITGSLLVSELAEALDGHGGISSIAKTSTSGLTDTYTITFADNTTTTYTVKNGKAISSIVKTAAVSPSLTDSYRINYNDGTYYDFTVDNGKGISSLSWVESGTAGDGQTHTGTFSYNDGTTSQVVIQDGVKGDQGDKTYVWIKYASTANPADANMSDIPDEYIGIYVGTATTAPATSASYTWFKWKGETGATGTSVNNISYVSSSGDVDTYRITMSDGNAYTYTVTNGSNISSITLTSQAGLTDTYTVLLTNGDSSTFTVTNAKSISSITMISGNHAAGTTDTYQILFNDNDTFNFSVYNGANGSGAVSTVAGIGVVGNEGDVPLIKWGNGAPTSATIGQEKQLYFDLSGGVMYICTGESSGTYSWASMGITVDSTLSSQSNNPVRNSTLTNLLGTTTMTTTAQTITGAINELDSGKQDTLTIDATPTQNSTNPIQSGAVYKTFYDVIEVTLPNVSNSNKSFAVTGITANHELVQDGYVYLSNPSVMRSDFTLTTGSGTVVVSGTFGSGSTNIVATFGMKRTKQTGTAST